MISHRSSLLLLFALLATAAAMVFLAVSIDPDLYAPGSRTLEHHLPGQRRLAHVERRLPHRARKALSPRLWLRKLYSIIAFAIVGFFAAPLLPRRARLRWDAALIAFFSFLIEVAQKLAGAHEGYASNLFDIACGAIGGLLGAVLWNALASGLAARSARR